MGVKELFNRALDLVDRSIEWLTVILMGFLLMLTFLNVVGRYVFQNSIYFSDELARFLFVWIVFLGAAIIIKDKGHVAVTFILENLKGAVSKKILETIISLCGILFIAIVFVGGWQLAASMNMYSSAALDIPMGYVYLVIPIGSAIMMIHQLKNLIAIFKTQEDKERTGEV
ncbi:MAG: TRAP transporter small permease [Deltaproteobacteria bacterium]|nr:TRAP transporter small permease [Deltaproteobacteria bacterium]